jgi:hypothetical protein
MSRKITPVLILSFCFFLGINVIGQISEQWVKRYNGTGHDYGYDKANGMAVDNQGNVFVTGSSVSSPTYSLDMFTIKYDKDGNELWKQTYAGADKRSDVGYAVVVDKEGNAYVTGMTESATTSKNFITIKYNKDGVAQWTNIYNGDKNVEDYPFAIVIDDSANVYVSGRANDGYHSWYMLTGQP